MLDEVFFSADATYFFHNSIWKIMHSQWCSPLTLAMSLILSLEDFIDCFTSSFWVSQAHCLATSRKSDSLQGLVWPLIGRLTEVTHQLVTESLLLFCASTIWVLCPCCGSVSVAVAAVTTASWKRKDIVSPSSFFCYRWVNRNVHRFARCHVQLKWMLFQSGCWYGNNSYTEFGQMGSNSKLVIGNFQLLKCVFSQCTTM